ncbi:hypothetical protein V6Z11_A02G125900 [Gossypium hirsutum]
MVNQGFIGPPVRDFHSQALNRYQVSIMTKQAEIQRLPNTGTALAMWKCTVYDVRRRWRLLEASCGARGIQGFLSML